MGKKVIFSRKGRGELLFDIQIGIISTVNDGPNRNLGLKWEFELTFFIRRNKANLTTMNG